MTERPDVTPAFFRLFDDVVDAYLIGDADDSLVFANRGARQLLRSFGPEPGDDIPAMFDDPERLKDLFTVARGSGDPTPVRATMRADDVSAGAQAADDDRNSRELLLEASGRRLDGRSLLLIRCRLSSQANEQFEAVNKTLAMEGELRRMSRARLGLERAYRSLDRFASVAAHDLKAPARHLSNLSAMLSDSLEGKIDDDEAELLSFIDKSASRLFVLVEDIYQFSKLASITEDMTTIELPTLIGTVMQDLQEDIDDTDARIEMANLPSIEGSEPQVRRLVQNLIQNAIKYRHADRAPVIRIEAVPVIDGGMCLNFEDNGQGFEQKYADKVFEPFARVTDDRAIMGSGLGLAACMTVAVSHGWSMTVQSEPGVGSVFSVEIPRECAREITGDIHGRAGVKAETAR